MEKIRITDLSKMKIGIQNVTKNKEMVNDYCLPFIRQYFINSCKIWNTILPEKDKRVNVIDNCFAEKWIEHTLSFGAQILAAVSKDQMLGIGIVHQCSPESEITYSSSLVKTIAESSLKLGFAAASVKKYLWTLRLIRKEVDDYFGQQKTFFWLLHPSPCATVHIVTARLLEYFINFSKIQKMPIVHEVYTQEQAETLEKFGFRKKGEIAFLYSEKLEEVTSLPNFDESNPPLKIWIMIYDPNEPSSPKHVVTRSELNIHQYKKEKTQELKPRTTQSGNKSVKPRFSLNSQYDELPIQDDEPVMPSKEFYNHNGIEYGLPNSYNHQVEYTFIPNVEEPDSHEYGGIPQYATESRQLIPNFDLLTTDNKTPNSEEGKF